MVEETEWVSYVPILASTQRNGVTTDRNGKGCLASIYSHYNSDKI